MREKSRWWRSRNREGKKDEGFVHRGNLCLGGSLLPLEDAAGARFTARFLVAADGPSARAGFGLFDSHIFVLVDPATRLEMIEKKQKEWKYLPAIAHHAHTFVLGLTVEPGCLVHVLLTPNTLSIAESSFGHGINVAPFASDFEEAQS